MKKDEWIFKLESEGFTDLELVEIPSDFDSGEHTHEHHTVHIILNGQLVIIDENGEKVYHPGDRVEFPKGTKHRAKGASIEGSMIVGVKKDT